MIHYLTSRGPGRKRTIQVRIPEGWAKVESGPVKWKDLILQVLPPYDFHKADSSDVGDPAEEYECVIRRKHDTH